MDSGFCFTGVRLEMHCKHFVLLATVDVHGRVKEGDVFLPFQPFRDFVGREERGGCEIVVFGGVLRCCMYWLAYALVDRVHCEGFLGIVKQLVFRCDEKCDQVLTVQIQR